jgi:hypothetical protein
MTGQDGGFSQAARRFIAEVDTALTRARRAAREAKAVSEDFRRRTGELGGQAKTGKLRGLRRGEVTPTTETARAEAVEFRTANGLPVEETPDADALIARLPGPTAEQTGNPEPEDFSDHRVLFDIDGQEEEPDESGETGIQAPEDGDEDREMSSPAAGRPRARDDDEDFSQQRILLDATVESYRPDDLAGFVFDPSEPKNTRSDGVPERGPDLGG